MSFLLFKRWILPEDMQDLSGGRGSSAVYPPFHLCTVRLSIPPSSSAEHKRLLPGDLWMRLDGARLGSAGRAFC